MLNKLTEPKTIFKCEQVKELVHKEKKKKLEVVKANNYMTAA